MGKCPDTVGINCNYVGCCPFGEVCYDDDDLEDNELEKIEVPTK